MTDIKFFPFPVLSPDHIDYGGCAYTVNIVRVTECDEIIVRHDFQGAGLMSELLRQGRAGFACVVSLPATLYRRVFVCESSGTDSEQRINYKAAGYGQAPSAAEEPMFRPIIIARQDIRKNITLDDKLNALWDNCEIFMPAGSIIGYSRWERFGGGGDAGILVICKDEDLKDGKMTVSEDAEGGFRFRVHVGESLYDSLQSPPDGASHQRASILTHALSAGFSILQRRYQTDYKEHVNLRLLADELKRRRLPHWADEDFQPEDVATDMYPHIFSLAQEESGSD